MGRKQTDYYEEIWELEMLRHILRHTRAQVADFLGIDPGTYWDWLTGQKFIPPQWGEKIARLRREWQERSIQLDKGGY